MNLRSRSRFNKENSLKVQKVESNRLLDLPIVVSLIVAAATAYTQSPLIKLKVSINNVQDRFRRRVSNPRYFDR